MKHHLLTRLEKEVLECLIDGDDPILSTLREQLAVCRIKDREWTGVGFYTKLVVPATAPRLESTPDFNLGDVLADIDSLELPAGFLLCVRNGALYMLEGYAFDGSWPEQVSAFRLSYMRETRDMVSLRKKWMARE